MAPSHGFAAASHREAALRGAPASHGETAFRGAAGFREARRREVHPARARWRSTRGSAEAQGLLAEVGISYFASAGETVTVVAAIVLLCGIGFALFGIVALGEWGDPRWYGGEMPVGGVI